MKWHCNTCGQLTKAEVTEVHTGNLSKTRCNRCDVVVPRVVDLTHPMPCIVSVRVTDDMIENDEIPY